MSFLKWLNVGLRGLMEAGIVLALGYWGYHISDNRIWKIILTIVVPLVGFGFWGMVDFHQFRNIGEILRLLQELVISGLAAIALYSAGAHIPGWGLGILSVVHHALTYLLGERLIKEKSGQSDN